LQPEETQKPSTQVLLVAQVTPLQGLLDEKK
jgi:hypothetical protein